MSFLFRVLQLIIDVVLSLAIAIVVFGCCHIEVVVAVQIAHHH